MKIVLSPAKSLDYKTAVPYDKYTDLAFKKEAAQISQVLKTLKPAELKDLMHISNKLATLNWERNQKWSLPITPKRNDARQAVFAFKGTAYEGLDAYSLDEAALDKLQAQLRIFSGQYGIIKPLDLILPYRLEMGTKLAFDTYTNLYDFWKPKLADFLNKEMQQDEVLINLASNEYFKSLDKKRFKHPIITPVFKDYKNGKLKTISFFAKKARGLMTRYIVQNDIKNYKDLITFNEANYAFDSKLSTEDEYVFTR